jgi:formate hydrogenlyase transcriptional activator
LRERREDIPLLVRHFVRQYAERFGKQIDTIGADTLRGLMEYSWPGNVRELQNFVQRSVILSLENALEAPLHELQESPADHRTGEIPVHTITLKQAERELILRALSESRWVIGGPRGAAIRLGLNRTTLISRMHKLGISRPQS